MRWTSEDHSYPLKPRFGMLDHWIHEQTCNALTHLIICCAAAAVDADADADDDDDDDADLRV